MAEIVRPGPVSGRNYGFVISGDNPTVDEQLRIDAAIAQQESLFADAYADQYGTRPAGAENDFLDYLGEFPKGVARGAVNMGEAAGLGLAALLPEEYELGAREAVRRVGYSLKPQTDIGMDETVSGKFGEALGSFAPLLAASVVPGGQFIAPSLAVGAGAGEASERARAAGATQEERNLALPFGAAVGALELLPIKFMKNLGRNDTLSITDRLTRVAGSAGVEGVQEAAAEIAQNLIAQNIYDPEQGTFTGSGESLGYGAGVGGLVQGLMDLAIPGKSRGPAAPSPAPAGEVFDDDGLPSVAQAEPAALAPSLADVDTLEALGLDPASDVTAETLDALGVNTNAAVYKKMRSGSLENREDALREIERYADAADERGMDREKTSNIREYVERARQQEFDLRDEGAADQDVGAGGSVDISGIANVDRGADVLAAPEPGELDVPRDRLGELEEADGRQPSALTEEEAFEMAASEAAPRPAPVEMSPDLDVEPEPALATDAAVEPVEQELIPGFDEMPAPETDVTDVDPFADLEVQEQGAVTAEEIESRAPPVVETDLQVEEDVADLEPGQEPAVRTVVSPEDVAPVAKRDLGRTAPKVGGADIAGAVDAARAQRASENREVDAQRRQQITQRYLETASPDLQNFATKEVFLDPADAPSDITTAEDKELVLALLSKKFTKREKTASNAEWAAHEYFRKHSDVTTAIDVIAYDAIAAPTRFAKITDDMSAGAKEYYRNTGKVWGSAAGKWVQDNLGPGARVQLLKRIDEYRPAANESAQDAVSAGRDNAVKKDRAYREYIGDQTGDYIGVEADTDLANELGFGTEDLSDIEALFSKTAAGDMPMHPQVIRAIQANDINGAVDGIIATAGSAEASKLAQRLRPYLQTTQTRIISAQTMSDIGEVFGDGRPGAALGVYMPVASEAKLLELAVHEPERANIRRELNGVMAFNEETGLSAITFLHEAVHAATMQVLLNKSHPLTKQVEVILAAARAAIPKSQNALLDRYEFVSEAMTNKAFIQELATVDSGLGANKYSLRQRLMHAIRNFLRPLVGKKRKPIESAKDAIDLLFDDILAPNVGARGAGSVFEAAFRPNGYRDLLNGVKNNVKEFTPKNGSDIRRLARSSLRKLPYGNETKRFIIRASAPLMFVAETATRYMPSAYEVYTNVMEHGARQHNLSAEVDETVIKIQEWLSKNPDKVDTFERIRFMATEARVDPRKPRSEYDKFELSYDILDSEGSVERTVRESFATRDARAAKLKRLRANPRPDRTDPKNSHDPETEDNVERLRVYDEISKMYRDIGDGGRSAIKRTFELPEYFRNEMKRVVQKRLDNMFEGQRTMQERIYKDVFNKIFAETLIDPYQALQRRGRFGLSYMARDPDTGEMKMFKHAFESTRARDRAMAVLDRLDSTVGVSQVTPYDMSKVGQLQQRPSMEFISAFLNKIDQSGKLSDAEVRKDFLDLVFEATPETSFFRAYQKRKGVAGYEGDVTPLDFETGAGDAIGNIRRNGMHLAAKVADIEYQVDLDKLRARLAAEQVQFEQDTNATVADPLERAANSEESRIYFEILNDFMTAPFRERANWSRTLTAGGYALTLGFNVSTAAMTFFQMPTIIFPYLSGKYGSRTSMQSIGIASRILTSSGKERTVNRVSDEGGIESVRREVGWYDFSVANLDFDKTENAYLQELRDVADKAGVFNRSLTQEILDETGAKGWVQKTAAYSGLLQHHSERYMRESTLVSTYLMELHRNVPQGRDLPFKQFVKAVRAGKIDIPADIGKNAADVAVHTSDVTNGSILAAAAPIMSQTDLGSVVYLFKRFPLFMLNMLWHTLKRAASSSGDPVDRRIAALQFGGMAGSMAMFAGASGIPGFHMVAALWDIIRDEEDEDLETLIRTGVLGEVGLTGVVDYFAGVSVSSRIGLSGVFYRPGFNTENQTALATLLEGFGGPVVGLFNKYSDRVPYFFNEGEYWRMTEAALPTAMGNAMKATRFYTEGARTLRNDPLLDEVGALSAGGQFFGFMPAEYSRQLAQNNYVRGIDNAINQKKSKINRMFYMARTQADPVALRRAEKARRDFNRRYPHTQITPESLAKSMAAHKRTSSKMHNGLTYSSKNEDYLKRIASDFGPATFYSD